MRRRLVRRKKAQREAPAPQQAPRPKVTLPRKKAGEEGPGLKMFRVPEKALLESQFAQLPVIPQEYVERLESGAEAFSTGDLLSLARHLGVEPFEFLKPDAPAASGRDTVRLSKWPEHQIAEAYAQAYAALQQKCLGRAEKRIESVVAAGEADEKRQQKLEKDAQNLLERTERKLQGIRANLKKLAEQRQLLKANQAKRLEEAERLRENLQENVAALSARRKALRPPAR